MKLVYIFLVYALVLALPSASYAQASAGQERTKNEIGFVIGATETPSIELARGGSISFDPSLALGIDYDRRLRGTKTTLAGGLSFIASPFDVKASNPPADISPEYAYIFVSPHVKLKFNARGTWQPWALFGGGYADFAPSEPRNGLVDVGGNRSSGTLEFGGGVDTRPLLTLSRIPVFGVLPLGARFEVRDFLSGKPNYGLSTQGSLQHNVSLAGGFVIHF